MKKNKNNEELQSRREFFKKAAKGVLPILGAIVLANVPEIGKASGDVSMGGCACTTGCYSACSGTCKYDSCKYSCQGCKGGCKYHSKY